MKVYGKAFHFEDSYDQRTGSGLNHKDVKINGNKIFTARIISFTFDAAHKYIYINWNQGVFFPLEP